MNATKRLRPFVEKGLLPYAEALELQREFVEQRQCDAITDTIIFCEHPPTYTLGVGAAASDIRDAGDVPAIRVGRGGGATYHGPGQLVGYPIIKLRDRSWRVSDYLCKLERTLIATVGAFGVEAHCEGPTRGVYVEDRKIAAIGIQVSRGIVWHGFALNVSCDLAAFTRITPCRQPNTLMTSLAQELEQPMTMSQVQCAFIEQWDDMSANPMSLAAAGFVGGAGGAIARTRSAAPAWPPPLVSRPRSPQTCKSAIGTLPARPPTTPGSGPTRAPVGVV